MEHPYTYILIRTDLTIPQQIVQASHAAQEAGRLFPNRGTNHIVLIPVNNEHHLQMESERLARQGIEFQLFYEPDNDTGYTALATEPLCGEERRPLRRYQLYTHPRALI